MVSFVDVSCGLFAHGPCTSSREHREHLDPCGESFGEMRGDKLIM